MRKLQALPPVTLAFDTRDVNTVSHYPNSCMWKSVETQEVQYR